MMWRQVAAVFVLLVDVLVSAGSAAAAPTDQSGEPSCSTTLSLPQRIEVSGTTMVTATLSAYPCSGSVTPVQQTACLKMQTNDSTKQCESATGTLDAQVYFAPYHPGMTYVSTGRSCGVVMSHETTVRRISKVCTDVGPQTATL
jgi:hypothetical protein